MSAVAYARLRALLLVRGTARRPGRPLAALGAVCLLVLVLDGLRDARGAAGVVAAGDVGPQDAAALLGLAVTVLVSALLVLGPSSSRYPSSRSDVAWLYPSPLSVRAVGLLEVVVLAGRRLAVLVAAVALVELGDGVLTGGSVAAGALLPGSALVVVALSALSIGAASTRARPRVRVAAQALGGLLAIAVPGAMAVRVLLGAPSAEALRDLPSPVAALGRLLLGDGGVTAVLLVVLVGAAGFALLTTVDDRLRERLVLDAELWAELQDEHQQLRATLPPRRPPFRGLPRLRGPWALSWFEVAQLRHAGFGARAGAGLLLGAALGGAVAPDLIPLLVVSAPFPVLVGAWTSGLLLHLRLGTFPLVPGAVTTRVLAVEVIPLLTGLVPMTAALALATAVADRSALLPGSVVQAATLLVAAFAARTLAGGLSWRDGHVRAAVFHRWLLVTASALIALSAALPAALTAAGAPAGVGALLTLTVLCGLWLCSPRVLAARLRAPTEPATGEPAHPPQVPA